MNVLDFAREEPLVFIGVFLALTLFANFLLPLANSKAATAFAMIFTKKPNDK